MSTYYGAADGAGEFEGEVDKEECHEEYVGADETISIEGNLHIGAKEEGMSDDGNVYEDIEKVRDSPEALGDHGFDPTGDDEHDESVEREDAEGERERIDFAGADVEGDENIGECWQDEWIKQEAYSVKQRKEQCLNGECVVNGK